MQGIRFLETEVNKGCLLLKTRWLTVWCGDWFNFYKPSCIYMSIYIYMCVCVMLSICLSLRPVWFECTFFSCFMQPLNLSKSSCFEWDESQNLMCSTISPIPEESSRDKRQYLKLIRDFTICRNWVDLQSKVFALKQQLMIRRSKPCCLVFFFLNEDVCIVKVQFHS